MNGTRMRRLTAVALLLAAVGGCGALTGPPAARVTGAWQSLLTEIRAFERRIGFADTGNFAALSQEADEYAAAERAAVFTAAQQQLGWYAREHGLARVARLTCRARRLHNLRPF